MNKAFKFIVMIGSIASIIAAIVLCCVYIEKITAAASLIKDKIFEKISRKKLSQ